MGKDEINDIIEDAYENTNFGSIEKIYSYLQKNNNKSISRQDIKTFLASQEEHQILKQTQKPKNGGHIIAMYPNEVWQMDILFLISINIIIKIIDIYYALLMFLRDSLMPFQ